jgi:UDP-N-acetylmuramate--alanine ligase
VEILKVFENMIIADIYSARENPIKGITSENLARAVGCEYIQGGLEEIAEVVKSRAKRGDNIITIGAGDVNKICEMLLNQVFTNS